VYTLKSLLIRRYCNSMVPVLICLLACCQLAPSTAADVKLMRAVTCLATPLLRQPRTSAARLWIWAAVGVRGGSSPWSLAAGGPAGALARATPVRQAGERLSLCCHCCRDPLILSCLGWSDQRPVNPRTWCSSAAQLTYLANLLQRKLRAKWFVAYSWTLKLKSWLFPVTCAFWLLALCFGMMINEWWLIVFKVVFFHRPISLISIRRMLQIELSICLILYFSF